MARYYIEPRTITYVKGYRFFSLARNIFNKYAKQLLDTGVNVLKTALEKVDYKAACPTWEFMGNKTTDQNFETVWKVKKKLFHHKKQNKC